MSSSFTQLIPGIFPAKVFLPKIKSFAKWTVSLLLLGVFLSVVGAVSIFYLLYRLAVKPASSTQLDRLHPPQPPISPSQIQPFPIPPDAHHSRISHQSQVGPPRYPVAIVVISPGLLLHRLCHRLPQQSRRLHFPSASFHHPPSRSRVNNRFCISGRRTVKKSVSALMTGVNLPPYLPGPTTSHP